jgi:PPOX class probable F420-dependent enzyme
MTDKALLDILADRDTGVLTTLKRDGRPQLSNVSYTFNPDTGIIRVSITEGRAKTNNLRRDPRASFHATTPEMKAYVVAEGNARLSPVAKDPHDDTVEELIDLFRAVNGEHPDWDDYRRAMVADRRIALHIPVDNVYGWAGYGA